jgi:nucleotide-binding universal stress UspA family protein
MSIRKILIPFEGSEDEEFLLGIGFALGRIFNAHVEVLHVGVGVREAVSFVGDGMTAAMYEQIMAASAKENRERAERARSLAEKAFAGINAPRLEQPAAAPGFSAAIIERPGPMDARVASMGLLADLVVLAKPAAGGSVSAALQAALRETGRPVLVAPPGCRPPDDLAGGFGRRIGIAWNGSVEAARALAGALPFLARAEAVTVLSVEENLRFGPTGNDVVTYLGWHGIAATAIELTAGPFGVGRALLAALAENQSDMLVMGAYSRSQMRRPMFGGVTAAVLAETPVPALMVR